MEQDYISNCCAAPIIMCDANGHGICLECKDNTVPEELAIPIEEPVIQVEEEQQVINRLASPAIFWKVISLLLFLLLFYQRIS